MSKIKKRLKVTIIMLVAVSFLLFSSCANSLGSQELFLRVIEPADQSIVNEDAVLIKGNTIVEAVVSVNGGVATVDNKGNFSTSVFLEQGANFVEVIASDARGNEQSLVLTIFRE
jgi:ABC-type oligopeptide transport system substrate-binding subunit